MELEVFTGDKAEKLLELLNIETDLEEVDAEVAMSGNNMWLCFGRPHDYKGGQDNIDIADRFNNLQQLREEVQG